MSYFVQYLTGLADAPYASLFFDAALKVTVLLALATVATALLRRSSSAVRHRVWCLTFAAILVLPGLSVLLPEWRLAVLPYSSPLAPREESLPLAPHADATRVASRSPQQERSNAGEQVGLPLAEREDYYTAAPHANAQDQPAIADDVALTAAWPTLSISMLWFAGALAALMPLLFGLLRTFRLGRKARPVDDTTWMTLFDDLCRRLGLARRVTLRETGAALMPMTWGVLRPVVLLPSHAQDWNDRLRRIVLLHELAHVKRYDVGFQLLGRVACALYWFHPLAWYALRRLRIERELACDDCVVLAGERASDYAAELLQIARSYRPVYFAAAVAMAQHSNLEHRLHALFDRACSHLPVRPRTARMLLASVLTLVTTIAAIRPAPRTAEAGDVTQPPSAVDMFDDGHVTVTGKVVDPQNKPFSGARVFALRSYWPPSREHAALAETKSDTAGRFSIALRKSQFDALGDWRNATIAAVAERFAPAWVTWGDLPAGKEPTLRLVSDDVPITGRIVNLEGKTVPGVTVRAGAIDVAKTGSLDPWLAALRRGELPWIAAKHLGDSLPRFDGWPAPALTDKDGRFRIDGIGRERRVELSLSGTAIAYQDVYVVTRPSHGPLIDSSDSRERQPVYGARFEIVAQPTRPIEGVVRAADNGQPLAGVRIESDEFAGRNLSGDRRLRTVSDEMGRFRLVGMPKGKGNRIVAIPADDQPYLMREFDVADPPGLEPVAVNLDLHRGTWITGRITEKGTGKPVIARVHYLPFRDNEFARAMPEFAELGHGHGDQDRYMSGRDGRYRLVGLPGRALVGAQCSLGHYRHGVGADSIEGLDRDGRFQTFPNPAFAGRRWPDSMQEINPLPGTGSVVCDLELDPGQTMMLKVVDRSGTPLTGFTIEGRCSGGEVLLPIETPPAEVINLGPDENRLIVVRHPARKLAKAFRLRITDRAPPEMTVTVEPSARIVGRLLDQNGDPLVGATITACVAPLEDFFKQLPPVLSGEDGRFVCDDVPTGCEYILNADVARMRQPGWFADDVAVEPGETKDLGDVVYGGAVKTKKAIAAGEGTHAAAGKEPPRTPAVRLVDAKGNPVAGAWIGLGAYGDSEEAPVWSPYSPKGLSDGDGRAEIVGRSLPEGDAVLYVRHEGRKLAAFGKFTRDELLNVPDLVLLPACRVYGRLTSEGLVETGQKLDWTNVYLFWGDYRPLNFMSKRQEFEFYLPSGKYRLNAYGTDTVFVDHDIEIADDQHALDVGAIDLPATKLAKLVGQQAPELRGIQGWKNSSGVTLADLRGKYVLLDFWGHWCGPCIRQMPHLMKLHDAFADRGLVVIAVHDASVGSIAAMDRKLNEKRPWGTVREREWWGRDMPFPVAVDGGTPPEDAERDEWHHGATTDAYGINRFPTTVLIDREGKVVKHVQANDANLPDEMAELLGVTGKLPTWRYRFDQVYWLAQGEVLRHVPAPFIPERTQFITERNCIGGAGEWPERFTLEWDGAGIHSSPHGDGTLISLLASLTGSGQPRDLFDCPAKLARERILGDWIVARDAPLAERLHAFEDLLRNNLHKPLRIKRRQVDRDIIAVSGEYRFVALRPDDRYIHLSTGHRDFDDVCGGGSGTLAECLDFLSHLIGTRFIADMEPPRDAKLQWYQHPSTVLAQPFPAKELDLILANLSRQTSLKFDRQRRKVDVWTVREDQ